MIIQEVKGWVEQDWQCT